jgi:hypothetical protein
LPSLLVAAALVAVVNLPFGYWRAGLTPRSARWFVAIHAPVPLVVLIRLWLGVGLEWRTFPVLVAAFALGQFAGGWFRNRRQ